MSRSKSRHSAWVAYRKGLVISDEELQTVKEDLETVIRVLAELGDINGITTRAIRRELDVVEDLIYRRTRP